MKFIFSKLGVNKKVDDSIVELIREAMGIDRTFDWIATRTDSIYKSTFFSAYLYDDIVVCVNFFTPFEFISNHDIILAHQSGFSATKVSFKGKGLWPALMRESERELVLLNSCFIFGFPNSISTPVFTKKLGYVVNYFKIDIFNLHLMIIRKHLSALFTRPNYLNNNYDCDYEEIKKWHTRQNGHDFIYEKVSLNAKLWGKIKIKNFMIFKISFLEIGGYQATSDNELRNLMISCLSENKVSFAVQVSSIDNILSSMRLFKLKYNQPFIYKFITSKITSLNNIFFGGSNRDVF